MGIFYSEWEIRKLSESQIKASIDDFLQLAGIDIAKFYDNSGLLDQFKTGFVREAYLSENFDGSKLEHLGYDYACALLECGSFRDGPLYLSLMRLGNQMVNKENENAVLKYLQICMDNSLSSSSNNPPKAELLLTQ